MNWFHRRYCAGDKWNRLVRGTLLPDALDGVDLGANVLELGAGPGLVTKALAPKTPALTAVEIDPALARTARRAVADHPNVTVVEADATQLDLPAGNLLVYMYHPFETIVTEVVLRRLQSAVERSPRQVTIAYLMYTEAVPRVRRTFAEFPWLHEVRYEQSVRGHYNWLLLSTNPPR